MSRTPPDFHLDFLVPGISKCGTTTLCALLSHHPRVFIPDEKEPLFFIHADHLQRLDGYVGLFRQAPADALWGEGSTFYSSNTLEVGCRDRIQAFNPDIKLIFIVRDPIDRIESSFREFHHSGPFFGVYPPFDLERAIGAFPDILEDSCYGARLRNYQQVFPEDQILVILLEDLKANPEAVLSRCFRFLGVDPVEAIPLPAMRLNDGEAKLRDTALMRVLRGLPGLGRRVSAWPLERQNRLGRRLGLRRPFAGPIRWTPSLRTRVLQRLQGDVCDFLAQIDRPVSVWPRFSAMLAGKSF